ncbi:type VI secretion system contractile sheath large subunit [Rubrivirga sp. SAORIC476]|uniref:type VI secretion system contractile sheath large subunit n=1 Tax=Rubrivirga sp. SAORIC476 TaxID=1961794 RepID=UPI0018E9158F|nr:type VI secretion system contractile sheath large subunit [Rubrivirga sp. SAORIC476]
MAEGQMQTDAAAAETTEAEGSLLDSILAKVDVQAPTSGDVRIDAFSDADAIGGQDRGAMMSAALRVFVDAVAKSGDPVAKIDKHLVDGLVADIDATISKQLDKILHSPEVQKLESAWRGLKFLVDRTDFRKNVKIEMLNVSKDTLRESFEDSPELIQSALYRHVYTNAYDQPGADPYSAIVSNYEFDASPQDMALLGNVSKVAASAHAPFLGAVGPQFFGKESMEDWKKIPDLSAYMELADFTKWNALRDTEDSRYLGLTFPRYLLRLPYGPDTVPVKTFNYQEEVSGADHDRYLWGNSSFAFASNMVRAFQRDGWSVQIRGPQSGGKVDDLPVHLYDVGKGKQAKIPTEVPISETLEFEAANLGFMPLSHYQGRDFAAFFSANSTQRPKLYDDDAATANSRINARLPYIFLASRIAHYLKVLQRENIGATKDAAKIEGELNRWLKGLVTEMENPSQAQVAKYPLKAAEVKVVELDDNPGFFRVQTAIKPHFQIEGMDISLSLVGKMPKK